MLAPIEAASTTPPAGLTRSRPAGRPPVVAPAALLDDQAELDQLAHPGGHRGPGQVGAPADIGPGVHQLVVDEREDVAGADPGPVAATAMRVLPSGL